MGLGLFLWRQSRKNQLGRLTSKPMLVCNFFIWRASSNLIRRIWKLFQFSTTFALRGLWLTAIFLMIRIFDDQHVNTNVVMGIVIARGDIPSGDEWAELARVPAWRSRYTIVWETKWKKWLKLIITPYFHSINVLMYINILTDNELLFLW